MRRTIRKTLSLVLALIMVISLFPANVFAADDDIVDGEEETITTTAGEPAVDTDTSEETDGDEDDDPPPPPASDPDPDPTTEPTTEPTVEPTVEPTATPKPTVEPTPVPKVYTLTYKLGDGEKLTVTLSGEFDAEAKDYAIRSLSSSEAEWLENAAEKSIKEYIDDFDGVRLTDMVVLRRPIGKMDCK